MSYHFNDSMIIIAFKWQISSNKIISNDAKCPQIDLLIINSSIKILGRLIKHSARLRPHLKAQLGLPFILGTIKINNLNNPILTIIQYILRFDISMTNPLFM